MLTGKGRIQYQRATLKFELHNLNCGNRKPVFQKPADAGSVLFSITISFDSTSDESWAEINFGTLLDRLPKTKF